MKTQRRKLFLSWTAAVLCAVSSGCALHRPRNPIDEVRRYAVVAFQVPPGFDNDPDMGLRLAEVFASELVQFPGIEEVIRPIEIRALEWKDDFRPEDPRQAAELAGKVGADAVVYGEVTEYRGYPPPRVGLKLQVHLAHRPSRDPSWAVRLDRQGRESAPAEPFGSGTLLFERIYDSTDRRWTLPVYLRQTATAGTPNGLTPEDWIYRIQDNYFRFVSDRAVRDLFALLKEKQLNTEKLSDGTANYRANSVSD